MRLCEDTCSPTCGGKTTLVTRLMEPVYRYVTQVTQGDFVSQVSNIANTKIYQTIERLIKK